MKLVDKLDVLTMFEERKVEDLVWNNDERLDFEEESAVRKLWEYYNRGLSVEDIVDTLNLHATYEEMEEVVKEVSSWLKEDSKESDEVTLEEYTKWLMDLYELPNERLRVKCNWEGVKTTGTKREMVERLKENYLTYNKVIK